MEVSEFIGEFNCNDGQLIICDSFPMPELVDPNMSQDGSQCLHVKVKPGKYQVMYFYFDEDAMDYNPSRVEILHESLKEMPIKLQAPLKLQVEGGRIAVIDRDQALDEKICNDFQYDAADTIHHNCGFVISTLGDGEYNLEIDNCNSPAAALSIILEENFKEEEVD